MIKTAKGNESVCPHINCLVNHMGNPCTCNMSRWCPECKGEYAPKIAPPETGKGWEDGLRKLVQEVLLGKDADPDYYKKGTSEINAYLRDKTLIAVVPKELDAFIRFLLRSEHHRWDMKWEKKLQDIITAAIPKKRFNSYLSSTAEGETERDTIWYRRGYNKAIDEYTKNIQNAMKDSGSVGI